MGIAPEDEPFTAPAAPQDPDGRRVGVLLCHGFTSTPASMRPWAEHLAGRGYAVSVPLLPGHATTWQHLNRTTVDDWYSEAEHAFEKLLADNDQVYVAGLSMGGLLALMLAQVHGRDVGGLVLVNPLVHSERKDLRLLPVLKHVVPAFPAIRNDIKQPGVEERGYSRTPLKAAHSLFASLPEVRRRLPEVTQPVLLFRSRTDHVLDASSGRILMSTVSSRDLVERVLEDSYHVAVLDNDAGTIFSGSAEFFRRVSAA